MRDDAILSRYYSSNAAILVAMGQLKVPESDPDQIESVFSRHCFACSSWAGSPIAKRKMEISGFIAEATSLDRDEKLWLEGR